MKFLLALFACCLASLTALAQSVTGEITALDLPTNTVSVSSKAGTPRAYRLRLTAEILLNGVKAKPADLAVGMTVKVTSGDPGFISKIEATGTPNGAVGPAGAVAAAAGTFEQRLIGTTWIWADTKDLHQTLTFKENGMAQWTSGEFTWKVSPGGGHRIEGITSGGAKYKMTFDEGLTTTTIFMPGKSPYKSKRADK